MDRPACREMLILKLHQFKPSSKESSGVSSSIILELTSVTEAIFQVTQKSVKDQFKLRMSNKEDSSRTIDEESERDRFLKEIKEEAKKNN